MKKETLYVHRSRELRSDFEGRRRRRRTKREKICELPFKDRRKMYRYSGEVDRRRGMRRRRRCGDRGLPFTEKSSREERERQKTTKPFSLEGRPQAQRERESCPCTKKKRKEREKKEDTDTGLATDTSEGGASLVGSCRTRGRSRPRQVALVLSDKKTKKGKRQMPTAEKEQSWREQKRRKQLKEDLPDSSFFFFFLLIVPRRTRDTQLRETYEASRETLSCSVEVFFSWRRQKMVGRDSRAERKGERERRELGGSDSAPTDSI